MLRRISPLLFTLVYLGLMASLMRQMDFDTATLLALIPLGILGLYLFVFHFSWFINLLVFSMPWTINLSDVGSGIGLSLPAELLLALSAIGVILIFLQNGLPDRNLLFHPVSIIILLQLVWIITTSATSSYSLISLKFTISRATYLVVFYFFFLQLCKDPKESLKFIGLYLLGFIPVLIYSIVKLSQMGIARKFAPEMAEPFFDDHTVLGACIAMLLPLVFIVARNPNRFLDQLKWRRLILPILILLCLNLFFSFSRAAWLSIIVASIFYFLLRIRIPFSVVLGGFVVLLTLGFMFQDSIFEKMQENKNVSGQDLLETAQSVTNVSSDESNQERVNRWSCAIRMWQDRPLLGFGPGTYERNYAPYQLKAEQTRISSKEGDRGDAHSEYLTALSEQGMPGLLIFLTLIFLLIRSGMHAVYNAENRSRQALAMGLLLGLITYFVHGAVNSFLDIEKAATLFWTMSAMLVVLDCQTPLLELKESIVKS